MIKAAARKLKESSWSLLDQAVVSGSNFLTGILLVRFLGLKEFGLFTFVWIAVQTVNTIQNAVIISPMMATGPKQSDEGKNNYFGAVVVQQAVFSAAMAVVCWGFCKSSGFFSLGYDLTGLSIALPVAVVGFQAQDFIRRYYFTIERPRAAFFNDCIAYLPQLVGLWAVHVVMKLDIEKALYVIGATSLIAVVVGVLGMREITHEWEVSKSVLVQHWKMSRWLLGASIFSFFSGNYYFVVAGVALGVEALGALKACQSIIGVLNIMYQGMQNNLAPKYAKAYHRLGWTGLHAEVKGTMWSMGLLAWGICVVVGVFPGWILRMAYGSAVGEEASFLLQMLSIYYGAAFFILVLSNAMKAMEASREIFLSSAVGAVISVLMIHYCVVYGSAGVVWGIILVRMIETAFIWFSYKSKRKHSLFHDANGKE